MDIDRTEIHIGNKVNYCTRNKTNIQSHISPLKCYYSDKTTEAHKQSPFYVHRNRNQSVILRLSYRIRPTTYNKNIVYRLLYGRPLHTYMGMWQPFDTVCLSVEVGGICRSYNIDKNFLKINVRGRFKYKGDYYESICSLIFHCVLNIFVSELDIS